jgi:hypothetical protein
MFFLGEDLTPPRVIGEDERSGLGSVFLTLSHAEIKKEKGRQKYADTRRWVLCEQLGKVGEKALAG